MNFPSSQFAGVLAVVGFLAACETPAQFTGGGGRGSGGRGALTGGATGSGGGQPNASGGINGGGVSGSGGSANGGQPGEGGVTGGGGASGGRVGSGGAGTGVGGSAACPASMKPCSGTCIAAAECCGGCSGATPVCSTGTCVKRNKGDACGTVGNNECSTGFCADGVCCDTACDGQCESCKLTGSAGTCLPATTPRTPCTGTGPCAGQCDGTTQNRRVCVFPGNTASCGAAAACTASSLTTAATCNGAGTCVAGTMMSCMYGCRTDGVVGCASMCATANQGLCGGTCVDVQSDPTHCGATCQACSGATSKCAAGKCVQCAAAADCSTLAGTTCTANSCVCNASGYHACGGGCYLNSDVAHCGTACTDCSQPNANLACVSNVCANSCKAGASPLCPAAAGKVDCGQWDFETVVASATTVEGWMLVGLGTSGAATAMGTSTVQHATGARSLAIPFNNGGDVNKYVEIRVRLCNSSTALQNLSGRRLVWSFRMSPGQDGGYNYVTVYGANFTGSGGLFDFNTDADGTAWIPYDRMMQAPTFDAVYGIGFHLQATHAYNGIIYLDNIRIE